MIKVYILSRRRSDMTHEQYMHHWLYVHPPLLKAQPAVKQYVRGYVQSRVIEDKPPGFVVGDTDGIVQLWFDDMEGVNAFYGSDNYRDVIQPDEQRFTDASKSEMFFVNEVSIIDSPVPAGES